MNTAMEARMHKYSSMDYWFSMVVNGNQNSEFFDSMYQALAIERPRILSVVAERSCNLQCQHCIFQREDSSEALSKTNELSTVIPKLVAQMPANSSVVHEGRIFRPWHLEWLLATRALVPDCKIGIIENGTYLNHAAELQSSGFSFDWMDVSVDGPETTHNFQRGSGDSYRKAIRGINESRKYIRPTGKVCSLFTLTMLNYGTIADTAKILPQEIDEWHITTLSPARPEIKGLATSDSEFSVSWRQIVEVQNVRRAALRIYNAEDLLKLAKTIGKEKLLSSLANSKVDLAAVSFCVDGVPVLFYPQSVSTSETFVVDADAYYRVPYAIAYSLEELNAGVSRFGENINSYTVAKLSRLSNLESLYAECVCGWKSSFGLIALQKEICVFDQIRNLK